MATQVLTNCVCLVGGFDLSGDINGVAIETSLPAVDVTTIDDTWNESLPGIKSATAELNGFWDAGTGEPDDVSIAALEDAGETLITFASSPSVGATTYSFETRVVSYSIEGRFGDVIKFSLRAEG